MAFASAGTGVVHALQYPLGALTKTAHGRGNTTLLPAVVQSNLGVRQDEAAGITRLTSNNPRPIDQDRLLAVLQDALDYVPRRAAAGNDSADSSCGMTCSAVKFVMI
jgi:alcohol dehydrogenase